MAVPQRTLTWLYSVLSKVCGFEPLVFNLLTSL
jgi:hypothetical protein